MVKANTVLGKAAVLAVLPALTLGTFAVPSAASADSGVNTTVNVFNTNTGMSRTAVISGANSGGNVIMADSSSTGGTSGSNLGVAAGARATAANEAEVEDVEAKADSNDYKKYDRHHSDHNDSGSAAADAAATGDALAGAAASSRTGNGGAAGDASTVSRIASGDAKSDVAVIGGADENIIDIEIADCGCDQANTYHEESMRFLDLSMAADYDKYYKSVEEKSETEGDKGDRHHRDNGTDEEWSYEEEVASESGAGSMALATGEAWSVTKKEYVPVTTVINVGNVNSSLSETMVLSGADSGHNAIAARSASVGGNSGSNMGVLAGADAVAANEAEVEDVEGGNATAAAGAHGSAAAGADAASETGNGGAGGDSTTDSMIVSGRSDSIVTVVETSRHNVVRIRR